MTIIGFDFSINFPAACISHDFKTFKWVAVTNTKLSKSYLHFLEGINLEFPDIHIVNLGEKNNKGASYSDTERKKLQNQLLLVNTLIDTVLTKVSQKPIVVGIEGFAYGAKGNSLVDIVQTTGILKKTITDRLLDNNLAGLFIFSPSELKNAISAKGNANKFEVFNKFIEDLKSYIIDVYNIENSELYENKRDFNNIIEFNIKNNRIIEKNNNLIYELTNVELNNLANFLRSKPSIKIELGGHTDTRGKAEDNQKLSADRAKAVYNYLIQVEHIDASRLTFIGYGETNPIISDQEIAKLATEVEREKAHQTNRRTVYKIIAQ